MSRVGQQAEGGGWNFREGSWVLEVWEIISILENWEFKLCEIVVGNKAGKTDGRLIRKGFNYILWTMCKSFATGDKTYRILSSRSNIKIFVLR